jgi:UDP-glucuronate 4-epimerase
MSNTILVTGGSGFIGSNVVDKLLSLSYRVVSIDNYDRHYDRITKEKNLTLASQHPLFSSYEVDIRDKQSLRELFQKYSFDLVIHLAGKVGVRPSIADPSGYYDVNVSGTITLLECMREYYVKKMLFASSSSVYGNNVKIPFAETDRVDNPISPYAASKKSAELVLHTYHQLHGLDVICFRFFTVYGQRQRPDLAIHQFFKNLYHDIPIDVYGNGSTSRDYTYVDDITDGVVAGMTYLTNNTGVYEIMNLGNHSPVTLQHLISLIEEVSGKKFKVNTLPMQPGDVERTYADIEKSRQFLAFNPQTTLAEGLEKFWSWFRKNP